MNIFAGRVKTDIRYCVTVSSALAVCIFSLYTMPLFCERPDTSADKSSSDTSNKNDEAASQSGWFVVKSNNLEIYCEETVNMPTVAGKLGREELFAKGIYGPNPTGAPPQKIAYMMDRLLKRAKEILDMNPDMLGLKVKIYKNREGLDKEYFRIFGAKTDLKSYYVHSLGTIYTCEDDISDSIIAYEMGHAIVDHYFSITPPAKIGELLAQYVDEHLED